MLLGQSSAARGLQESGSFTKLLQRAFLLDWVIGFPGALLLERLIHHGTLWYMRVYSMV